MNGLWLGIVVGLALAAPLGAWLVWRADQRSRRSAEQARRAERLAELGTLTGGLAHEIRNPLSSVGMNIQLLQEDLHEALAAPKVQQDPDTGEQLRRIQRRIDSLGRETQRLRDILEDFLQFAGRIKLNRQTTDINALIDELVDFFGPQASAMQVPVRTQLDADPPTAWVDPALVKQAVLNLMLNACQAMVEARQKKLPTGGGELMLRTTRRGANVGLGSGGEWTWHNWVSRQRDHNLGAVSGDAIEIHVIDTGPGMTEDRLAKIFHAYFSTKKGGTGLGLPTTRRIIDEHGGAIRVHSELGRGSEFVMTLPVQATDED